MENWPLWLVGGLLMVHVLETLRVIEGIATVGGGIASAVGAVAEWAGGLFYKPACTLGDLFAWSYIHGVLVPQGLISADVAAQGIIPPAYGAAYADWFSATWQAFQTYMGVPLSPCDTVPEDMAVNVVQWIESYCGFAVDLSGLLSDTS